MFGRVVLKPGSGKLDTARIVPATDRKRILVGRQGDDANDAGFITEEIDLVDDDGQAVIRRVLDVDSKVTGNQRTVVMADARTLRPVSHETKMRKLKVTARYSPGKVNGYRKKGNHTQVLGGVEMPKDVFDLSTIELLLRSVELSDGWSAKLNAADAIEGRVVRVNLDVKGSEKIGATDCWIVQSKTDNSKVVYWVAKNEPKIMKQAFSPKQGVHVEFVSA